MKKKLNLNNQRLIARAFFVPSLKKLILLIGNYVSLSLKTLFTCFTKLYLSLDILYYYMEIRCRNIGFTGFNALFYIARLLFYIIYMIYTTDVIYCLDSDAENNITNGPAIATSATNVGTTDDTNNQINIQINQDNFSDHVSINYNINKANYTQDNLSQIE